MSSSYRFNRLGLSHWDPYAVCRGVCLELYYYNTVGLAIQPIKIIPEMTYCVSSGTLNPTHSLTHICSLITLRMESKMEQNDVLFAAATVPLQTLVNI